jgi:hypothetical protein
MAIDSGRYLIIPDLQIPFQHEHSLSFCIHIAKHFGIPLENVLNVGDEVDQYYGGLWPKDPNAKHTHTSEIKESREILKQWYEAFPLMRLADSNHGSRWKRKATKADIPSMMMRDYREVLEAPPGWKWEKKLLVKCKHPFMIEHGDRYGGSTPHLLAAMHNGMSTAIGHHHTLAGIEYRETDGFKIWAMATGSLIDFEQYAFEYAKDGRFKPQIGVGVVLDEGAQAQWIPLR